MIDDQKLIRESLHGDLAAFKLLFERHREIVYRTAYDLLGRREDAEDASQEVFLKVYRSLQNFRGDSKVSTWMFRITVNTCHDMMSRKAYRTTKPVGEHDEQQDRPPLFHADADGFPGRKAESAILGQRIERALDILTPKERSVFVLRHYQDLPLAEVASVLGMRQGTVRSVLFRALKRLQNELKDFKPHPQRRDRNES